MEIFQWYVPGVHFLHVSIHLFHVFLFLHLPFFKSFLHFLVEILSLQSVLWMDFSLSEKYVSKTCCVCGVLRTRVNWDEIFTQKSVVKIKNFHCLSKEYFKHLSYQAIMKNITLNYYFSIKIRKIWMNFNFEIDFWKSDLGSFWQPVWKSV